MQGTDVISLPRDISLHIFHAGCCGSESYCFYSLFSTTKLMFYFRLHVKVIWISHQTRGNTKACRYYSTMLATVSVGKAASSYSTLEVVIVLLLSKMCLASCLTVTG